jgi:hypothetical protein
MTDRKKRLWLNEWREHALIHPRRRVRLGKFSDKRDGKMFSLFQLITKERRGNVLKREIFRRELRPDGIIKRPCYEK